MVRTGSVGQNFYNFVFPGALGASHTSTLRKIVAGVLTNLSTIAITPATLDVFHLVVVGTAVSVYQNGNLILEATDADLVSGSPGLDLFDSTTLASNTADNWAGGGVATPSPIPVPGGAGTAGDMLIYNRWCSRLW
jgi:hypothetical protein